ncbi:radical SAM protein [Candidatus Woesearchaeota archaeon]|nr:radical SAM protein [Candidatus Woesearchaeota archaeon]
MDWHNMDTEKTLPLATIRGCVKAEMDKRCSFCSIDSALRTMDPELVWKQIDHLKRVRGLKFFWEGGDSFIVGDYPQRLLAARPEHLSDISWKIYTSPQQINEEVLETLVRRNVRNIFVGIESSADALLDGAGKGFRLEDIERALELIDETGMDIHVPFIYGMPGETVQTAESTFDFARRIIDRYNITTMVTSLALPLPGTEL